MGIVRRKSFCSRGQERKGRDYSWLLPTILLTIGTLVSCYTFLIPGYLITTDFWPHFVRQKIVYQSLKDRFSPFYSFLFYSGYPHLRFYSPLFPFLSGFFTLFTGGDLLLALKILLVLLHLLSAGAMYAYLKYRTNDHFGSVLGTIVYLFVPWRVLYIAARAHFPLALIYILLPLSFLSFEILIKKPNLRNSLFFGIYLNLLIISHIIYAGFVSLFLFILFLFNFRKKFNRRLLIFSVIAILATVGLSGFFLLPFLFEYRSHIFPLPLLRLPPPNLSVLLGFESKLTGYSGIYLGLSNILLVMIAVISLFTSAKSNLKLLLPFLINLLLAFFLVLVVPLLGRIGSLLILNLPPERFLSYFIFFSAILIPTAYSAIKAKLTPLRIKPAVILTALSVIIIIDCLPSLIRVRYFQKEEFLGVRETIYHLIRKQNPTKVLDINIPVDCLDELGRICGYPGINFIYGDLPTPLGPPYHQFAPRSMLYAYPLINQIATDLGDQRNRTVHPNSLKALTLLGVSHLIIQPVFLKVKKDGEKTEIYLLTKQGITWDTNFLRTQRGKVPVTYGSVNSSLVLASNLIRPFARESIVQKGTFYIASDWERLLDTVSIDFERNRINFIPVKETQSYESLPGQAEVLVLESNLRHHQITLRLVTKNESFLRLAFSYYPELKILIDGRPIKFFETKDHFIYLKCPAGMHTLEITASLTPFRKSLLFLSGITLLISLLVIFFPRRTYIIQQSRLRIGMEQPLQKKDRMNQSLMKCGRKVTGKRAFDQSFNHFHTFASLGRVFGLILFNRNWDGGAKRNYSTIDS